LAQEEAQLEKAKRDEARLKPLFEENAVSRKDYEDAVSPRETAQARVQSARAGVTEAQLNLDYTNVQAPINGVTGRAEKSEGSLVAAGTDLLTRISQVDPNYAISAIRKLLCCERVKKSLRSNSRYRRITSSKSS